jgi:uncharacterized protein YecT (DUF1311 family)
MRAVLATAGAAMALLVPAHANQYAECEIDLSGPIVPAYLCAERLAERATAQVGAEFKAALAALPSRPREGGPFVTQQQLRSVHAKWRAYAHSHCQFVARVPGESGDWHIPIIFENSCLARLYAERASQLRTWRACFEEGGGECMP